MQWYSLEYVQSFPKSLDHHQKNGNFYNSHGDNNTAVGISEGAEDIYDDLSANLAGGHKLLLSAGLWNLSGELFFNRSQVIKPDGEEIEGTHGVGEGGISDNWWGLLAIMLVFATAAGNILVCLAITWERRLQNVTNYFLMSLAITDLMVAVLVMPLGILNLIRGFFPLAPVYCLAWICLDVLFCTASIMHLCTISVDRYLSLRYPIKFGRNKTCRRVTLKIVFVWLLSIAMSLPLSLMYSKDYNSVLVDGTCQIPDPLYKLIGSIVCFYIPLCVMLITYALTVRLLAVQQQNLGGKPTGWSSGWMEVPGMDRVCTWRRLLYHSKTPMSSMESTPQHLHPPVTHHHSSSRSTDTDMTTLDTHDLWLPDSEPAPSTLSALHQFGAEMLRLSRGLESVGASLSSQGSPQTPIKSRSSYELREEEMGLRIGLDGEINRNHVTHWQTVSTPIKRKPGMKKRRATTIYESEINSSRRRGRICSLHENKLDYFRKKNGCFETPHFSDSYSDECHPVSNEFKTGKQPSPIDRLPHESRNVDAISLVNDVIKNSASQRKPQILNSTLERIKSDNLLNKVTSKYARENHAAHHKLKRVFSDSFSFTAPGKSRMEELNDIYCKNLKHNLLFVKSGSENNLDDISFNKDVFEIELRKVASSQWNVSQDSWSKKTVCLDNNLKETESSGNLSADDKTESDSQSNVLNAVRSCKYSVERDERKPGLSLRTIQNAQIPEYPGEQAMEILGSDEQGFFSDGTDYEKKDDENEFLEVPPPCNKCPYFCQPTKSKRASKGSINYRNKATEENDLRDDIGETFPEFNNQTIVKWDHKNSVFGEAKMKIIMTRNSELNMNRQTQKPTLRRAATVKNTISKEKMLLLSKLRHNPPAVMSPESPVLVKYGSTMGTASSLNVRNHHSRNSSLMARNSSRHGRIIRLEQKATKVLGVVFFTFVILWAPFFVLNLVPSICSECEKNINKGVFDLVTWLGYASSMVNPIFYTIFNKVFRQTFKKVLLCKYHRTETWKPIPKK